jgi:rubrerythrin
MFSIADIIEMAIQIEKNGESVCRKVLAKNVDSDLASLFEWMAEQESNHIKWLQKLKCTTVASNLNPEMEQMGRSLLRDIIGEQGFSLSDADFSKIETKKDLFSLLIEFENDTVLFYEMIKTIVDDQTTLTCLDTIIKEERAHGKELQSYLENSAT